MTYHLVAAFLVSSKLLLERRVCEQSATRCFPAHSHHVLISGRSAQAEGCPVFFSFEKEDEEAEFQWSADVERRARWSPQAW